MGFSAFLLSVVLGFNLVALGKGSRNGDYGWLHPLRPSKYDLPIARVSQVLHLRDPVMVMETIRSQEPGLVLPSVRNVLGGLSQNKMNSVFW